MNKKAAQFNIQGMLVAVLMVGLFFTAIITIIGSFSGNYDTTGYDQDDIEKYNLMPNISTVVNDAYQEVDKVTVDPDAFDYLASIWNKITSPFKTVYRSFALVWNLSGDVVDDLQLMDFIGEFFSALLLILVIIGIVMIKYYGNKQK